MFKNKFIKKLSIGIASLALVCPLALGATQSVSAKSHKPATDLAISGKASKRQKLLTRKYSIHGKYARKHRLSKARKHLRKNRVRKTQRLHNAKRVKKGGRIYNNGVKLANLMTNNKLNSTQLARLLKKNLTKRMPLNNKTFAKGYIKQYRYRNRKGGMSYNEAKHSLQGIKLFAANYKNRLFYKGFALANMETRKQEINGYVPPKSIQRYKHNRNFLKGLEAWNMFESSSKSQAKEMASDYFMYSIE